MDSGNWSYAWIYAEFVNGTQPCPFSHSTVSNVFIIIILIIGIIGNVSLVLISLTHRDMRTPPNLMIVNLAMGDLVFLIMVVPSNVAFYNECMLILPKIMCKLHTAATFLTQGVSVYTLTALSVDRYQAIARPLRRRRGGNNHPKLRAFCTVVIIWTVSILFAAPAFKMAEVNPYGKECHLPFTTPETNIYFPIFFIGSYCIPLVAILVFYSLTAETLLHGLKHFNQGLRTGSDRRHKSRVKLAIIILIAALSFAICWLPHHIFTLWFEFCSFPGDIFSRPRIKILFILQQILPLLSCCLNPILLYAMSSNYRRKFRILLRETLHCNFGLLKAKEPLFRARTWTLISLRTTSLTRGSPSLNKPMTRQSSMDGHERDTPMNVNM